MRSLKRINSVWKCVLSGNYISLYGNAAGLLGNDMFLFGHDSCALCIICFLFGNDSSL